MSLETMTKLSSTTVGVGGTSTVTFSNISQNYTDLKILISARTSDGNTGTIARLKFNGSTTGYSSVYAQGRGDSVATGTGATTAGDIGRFPGVNSPVTDNVFSNTEINIPNYTGYVYKTYTVDCTTEANQTIAYLIIASGLWSNPDPITSIDISSSAGTISENSTFTLYGIKNAAKTAGNSIKATGGNIVFDGTYVYHTFTSSGTFSTTAPIPAADVFAFAGGGGAGSAQGGGNGAGGGGAGGYLTSLTSFPSGASGTITIGAGGAAGPGVNAAGSGFGTNGTNGNTTTFGFGSFTLAPAGGGGGGRDNGSSGFTGTSGASGGGGAGSSGSGGSVSPSSQGNAGGAGSGTRGGGGGGAGAAGVSGATSGNGGAGVGIWYNGTTTYFAGGGGVGARGTTAGSGGIGGGGNGKANDEGAGNNGDRNTGGGGGAGGSSPTSSNYYEGGSGGSGIVIIRYKA